MKRNLLRLCQVWQCWWHKGTYETEGVVRLECKLSIRLKRCWGRATRTTNIHLNNIAWESGHSIVRVILKPNAQVLAPIGKIQFHSQQNATSTRTALDANGDCVTATCCNLFNFEKQTSKSRVGTKKILYTCNKR